jgi:Xaa-Pro aminopeptidase
LSSASERILTWISDAELERRWRAVRQEMAARKLDALVMQNASDWLGGYVKWFTDLPANNGYPRTVIFHRDAPMTVIEMGPRGGKRSFNGGDGINRGVGEIRYSPSFLSVEYTGDYDAKIALEVLRERGCKTVGIVGGAGMPHGFIAEVEEAIKGSSAVLEATEFVDHLKAVKSPEEIKLIRAAAEMQDEIFAKVLAHIKPGMRDIDVTAYAQYEGQRLGSEQGIFLGGSAPLGQASVFRGRHLQGRTLKAGDQLALLIENNSPGGFYTEIARTIVLGKASNELIDGFEAMKEAQAHTLSLTKPGVDCAEIAAAHDQFMRSRGLPIEARLYAHGQGYDMVERPLIRGDETMRLEAGMNLAVHPGYESASQWAVICDNYLVETAGVSDCLHRTEKKIFEV